MTAIIKTTVRLLLRNKGFLFFLLILPVLSTLMLSLKVSSNSKSNTADYEIIELESIDTRAVYSADSFSFRIKVFDGSCSELSEYVLDKLAKNGMFSVCRADVRDISEEDILAQVKKDGFDDRAGVIVYLKNGFDSAVLDDSFADGMEIFISSDDEREEFFETEMTDILSNIYRAGIVCGGDKAKVLEMLGTVEEKIPHIQVTETFSEGKLVLTDIQNSNSKHIGYAFSIITLGFMFAGKFTVHSIINEERNKVFIRFMLSGRSYVLYFAAKFIVMMLMCLIQTGILAVCLMFVKGLDLGMPMPEFLLMIFLLGVIIGAVSMLTGIIFNDIMSTNYAAFALWSISSILAGLWFPIGDSSKMMLTLSLLIPQKWFFDISKMFLAGISGATQMLLCVTAAYLIVIISVGSVCLKIKKQEP